MSVKIDPGTWSNFDTKVIDYKIYKKYKDLLEEIGKYESKSVERFRSVKCKKCKKILCFEKYTKGPWEKSNIRKFYCKTCRQIEEVKK